MAFEHTNKITTVYTAGGASSSKTATKTETGGGEINISETVTLHASEDRKLIEIKDFAMDDGGNAKSVLLELDGWNGALYASGIGAGNTPINNATKIKDLDSQEPVTWSYNGGSNFPAGTTNPIPDGSISGLFVYPDASGAQGIAPSTAATLTVRVLYDPTP
tara:strand:- start:334 stop:819 length:486 start_codon:yes stop_codon:yes gene_type:complete